MIFFSLGILTGFSWIVYKCIHKPLAKIYQDRIESLVPFKNRYEIIPFMEVQEFNITQYGTQIIRADLSYRKCKNTVIIGFLVNNLNRICDLLNERLEKYWCDQMVINPKGGKM